jgi:PAS domain S-box-containing protein
MGTTPRVPKFVSGNFQSVTGFPADELLGNPNLWEDRLHPDDRAQVITALAARDRGGSLAIEYRWRCADGQYRHFLDHAVLLRDGEGRPLEFAGTLLDVTERKDLETQLLHVRKMDAIGKLTGGIAHDFNNLLAAVIGGLGILERRAGLSEDHRKILAMTQHAAGQGSELVSRLLAFARKQRLEPAPVDLRALADAVSNLLTHTLGGLVEIEWDLEPGVSPPYADEAQLELALMNLAINARDAMPQGGTIRVSARDMEVHDQSDADLPPGAYVALTVSDTGCGIAPDLLERVMEPFFTTKAVGKGTGLGLSMVYGFASQSGGTVRIESREGEGTRVALLLPKALEAAATSSEAECAARTDAGPALSILLVDDHDGVRATTAALLEELGHRSFAAADGPSILEKFNSDPIGCDLLISDYAMPHLSGVEVIRRARQVRPELPAIIITGYADHESIDLGCENIVILNKPFSPLQLQQTILNATGF